MKKQIITKVLFACFILAVGGFVLNVQAQDIVLEFLNPGDEDWGSSNEGYKGVGLGGSGSGAIPGSEEYWAPEGVEPHVEFAFTISPGGQVGLDVITAARDTDIIGILDTWDNANIGAVTDAALFGKSFSLILTAESRMQLGKGEDGNLGGIGVRGKNQRRIDDEGDNLEWMEFELVGDVGIDFVRIGYNDVAGGAAAVAVVKDHDTDAIVPILDDIDGAVHPPELYIEGADFNMRYFTDILHFTTTDTSSNEGYKLWSLEFNIVPAADKPPAVASTTPPNGDSLTFTVTDDYVIEFDATLDQAASEAAVSISPSVSNRVNTWSSGDAGDVLTISFDDLEFETWYTVVLSTAVLGTNGLNMLEADTITFKTLPEPPKVVSTFPANLDEDVPIDAPISIEFSKSMVDTTVEQSISFNPEIYGLSFVWNEDNTAVYISYAVELAPSNMYFGTVDVGAMDEFEIHMSEPHLFAFTTSLVTSVDNSKASEFAVFPNPAKDILQVRGVDVASVRIYSVTGQMVKEVNNSAVVNVSDIETGIYVIDVIDLNDNRYRELILIK